MFMGVGLAGYFYEDLAAWHVMVLVVGHQISWIGEWSPIRRLAPWKNGVLRLVGATMFTASVVASAASKNSQDGSGYY